MRIGLNIIIVLLILMTAISCNTDRCFKPMGETHTRVDSFTSFKSIYIYGVFNVELIEDSSFFIESYGMEQVLEGIEFEKINDTLNCYYYNSCFWRRDYDRPDIRIHYPEIHDVNVMESAKVFSNDTLRDPFALTVRADVAKTDLIVNTSKVYMYNNKSSAGHFIFRGKTDNAYIMVYHAGYYDMGELECVSANIKNYSVLDAIVNVKQRLTVEIYNTGNILYKGSPEIIVDTIVSSGNVLPFSN